MQSESVKIQCPDCGGIIGALGPGDKPCTCAQSGRERHSGDDTQFVEGAAKGIKLCISCGKDLAGHRRIKDSRGYTCMDCAKAERQTEIAGTIPCAECGRRIREQGILDWAGTKICRKCHQQHKESNRQKFRVIAKTTSYSRYEKSNILRMSAVAGILLLIILWRWLRH